MDSNEYMLKAFKNNQAFMESVMERLADPVTVVGKDFEVKWMNAAARRLIGMCPK